MSFKLNYITAKCTECNMCVNACSTKSLYRNEEGYLFWDMSRCNFCAECIDICPNNAMVETMDKIKVIEQTTAERKEETRKLFNEVKPLLDNGVPFYRAVKQAKQLEHDGFLRQAWYKELKKYAKTQGYAPKR